MKALVLCAGFGTRFRPATLTTPKPLLPFLGRPILHHLLDHLLAEGVTELVLNAHHLAERLARGIGDSYRGAPVALSREETILGTAGGIRLASERGLLGGAAGGFLVANGDVYTTLKLGPLLRARREPGVVTALAVLPNPDPASDTPLWSDARGRLAAVGGERPFPEAAGPWLFTGLQAAWRSLVDRIPPDASDLARDVLVPSAVARDGAVALVPYRVPEDGWWFDLGSKEKLARAEALVGGTVTSH